MILITQEAETQAAKKARGQEGREHAECIGAQVEMGSDIQNEREREETGAVTPSASSAPFGLKTRHIMCVDWKLFIRGAAHMHFQRHGLSRFGKDPYTNSF